MMTARILPLLMCSVTLFGAAAASAAEPASPAPTAPGLARLDLTVAPYGDVRVDGRLQARNATHTTVWLAPGIYEVEVRNPWARASRRRVEVPASGAAEVIRLEPRPARLVLVTNVDAEVRVDGRPVGRSWTSELLPLSVPVEGWRARRQAEIVVKREGFEPRRFKARLEAGTTTRIDARLEPAKNARRRPRSPTKALVAEALGVRVGL